jgi:hypothetical protein
MAINIKEREPDVQFVNYFIQSKNKDNIPFDLSETQIAVKPDEDGDLGAFIKLKVLDDSYFDPKKKWNILYDFERELLHTIMEDFGMFAFFSFLD